MIEILYRYTSAVLYSSATATEIVQAVVGARDAGANLSGADLSRADLSGADLYGADLSGADLYGADLSGASLSKADLSGASLSKANLSKANLSGANLFGADLSRANLSRANLSGANLSRADLSGADLSRANLSGANLSRANLSRADLSGVKGITPKVLQIGGSRHWIIVREYGCITVGCEHHAVEWWEEHYKAVGREEGYSDAEVEEYREHIAACRRFMERYSLMVAPE